MKALLPCLLLASACAVTVPPSRTFNADRALLESALERVPSGDPQLIVLLFGQYAATNQQRAGVAFFQQTMARHERELTADLRALYLSVIATLKCQMAAQIPLLKRIAWVEGAIADFERANAFSQLYIVRWLRAIVYAQLPGRFDKAVVAQRELAWLLAHAAKAPVPGLERELYYCLALLAKTRGDESEMRRQLARSGYRSFERELSVTTSFSVTRAKGFAFTGSRLRELIPGRLYQASGYEFAEYYFVVTKGGKQLLSIDAGSRDDSARAVYEQLQMRYPGLPPLTAVFITHAHWDHVGGHRFFRGLPSKPRFYANARWREQLHHQEGSGGKVQYWFGTDFEQKAMETFRADFSVSERQRLDLDGTTVELIPSPGGETRDGLLIHLPGEKIVFTGDMIMPYLGAPFVDEGSVSGLVQALEIVRDLAPMHVLHGHDGINRVFFR